MAQALAKAPAKAPFRPRLLKLAEAATSYSLGSAALLALTAAFLWTAPIANGPAAVALAAAIALDAGSRLVAETVSRRSGVVLAMRGLPSLVLPLGAAPGLAAAVLALLPLLAPDRFPLVASPIAGMIAMGGLARLSLIRSVLALAKTEARDPLAPV